MNITKKIILNTNNDRPNSRIIIKQGCIDTITLIVTINDKGGVLALPTGTTAKVRMLKPDKKQVLNDCVVSGNNVHVEITQQMQAVAGDGQCEVILLNGAKTFTTVTFPITIEKNVHDDSQIESTPEYSTLINSLIRIEDAVPKAEQAYEMATEAQVIIQSAETKLNQFTTDKDTALTQVTNATQSATTAADLANAKAGLANTAASKADTATTNANTATANANNKIVDVETRFQALTTTQQQDAEVVDARKGKASLRAKIDEFDSQLAQKANQSQTDGIQQQVNNLVLGAVGDGNNAEVIQGRSIFTTLNDRLSDIENRATAEIDGALNQKEILLTWVDGGVYSTGNIYSIASDSNKRTNPIRVYPNVTYKYTGSFSANSNYCVGFYSTSNPSSSTLISVLPQGTTEFKIPIGARYIILTNKTSVVATPCFGTVGYDDKFNKLNESYDKVTEISTELNGITTTLQWVPGYASASTGNISNYGDGSDFVRTDFIKLYHRIQYSYNGNNTSSAGGVTFYNTNSASGFVSTLSPSNYSSFELPSNATYAVFSNRKTLVPTPTLTSKSINDRLLLAESKINSFINCWGDSITDGMGMAVGNDYPSQLQKLVGSGYTVKNCGSSGERCETIMARMGSLSIYTESSITFAQGSATATIGNRNQNAILTSEGDYVKFTDKLGNAASINPAIINDVEYTLSYVDNGGAYKDLTLTRSNTANALTIPAGSQIFLNSIKYSQDICDVVYMGANGNFDNVADLIFKYNQIINSKVNNNIIIIIPTDRSTFDTEFDKAFGNKAINIRKYLMSDDAFASLGITKTQADIDAIALGKVPPSFTYDGVAGNVHFNANGYKLMAQQIYNRMKRLGYIIT